MKNGPYELVLAPQDYPGKKYRDRYCYEHYLVWWKTTGQVPQKGYEIHHKNGNHRDNKITNLQLLTAKEHRMVHGEILRKKAEIKAVCGFCKKTLYIRGNEYRSRMKNNKYNKVFCNQYCGAKHQYTMPCG
jgi:RNase P subunit RPR2